jgi:hypothetical protein
MINIALITKPEAPSITGQSMPWKKNAAMGSQGQADAPYQVPCRIKIFLAVQ